MNSSNEQLTKHTPPNSLNSGAGVAVKKTTRSSNLELYRIICMLMIVAHHFVANSGLAVADGPIAQNPFSYNSIFLLFWGAWGKTGINCFLLITGYFMCTSKITFRKFLKLMLQVYLYKFVLFFVFLFFGYENNSLMRVVQLLMPITGLGSNYFVDCFIVFWMTIPFLTMVVQNTTKRQHQLLLLLLLTCYTILGTTPSFPFRFNYISWFGILFFISSYIRLYPTRLMDDKRIWGWMTLASLLLSFVSIIVMTKLSKPHYYFLEDSNKILALTVAICSFLWFKNMDIKYSKIINAFGAGTFGVLLIHANSNAMRTWLWKDTVDCVGHYSLPIGNLVLYSVGAVLAIFVVCNLIDQLRINTLEKWFFKWYDKKYATKVDFFVSRIVNNK